jgi:hypothetical protein
MILKKIVTMTAVFGSLMMILCGCNRKNAAGMQYTSENHMASAGKLKHISAEAKAYLADKHICIIFGYGFNDSAFVQRVLVQLDADYGIQTENEAGLILEYVYPDDFMHSGKERISKLADILEDEKLAGILILGAPEGTHAVIARMQDKAGGSLSYPVFSLFPQDDVLGTESTANFVLDYPQKTDTIGSEDAPQVIDSDADELILNSVQAMVSLRGPVPADDKLHPFVQKLVGSRKKVSRYNDSETGLQAVNHFIIE